MYSHKVSPTCDSVFNGTRCPETRRLVGDNKKRACPRNHDYKVRIFMGAMRVSHELGFYGLRTARTQTDVASVTSPETPDAVADWMISDVEDQPSEHDELETVLGMEELTLDDSGCAQRLEEVTPSSADLILF